MSCTQIGYYTIIGGHPLEVFSVVFLDPLRAVIAGDTSGEIRAEMVTAMTQMSLDKKSAL